MKKSIAICLSLHFFTNASFAFDPEVHEKITESALALYTSCRVHFPERLSLDLTSDGARITKHNEAIDNPTPSRMMNWHFYDSAYDYKEDKPGRVTKKMMINRSLHHYFIRQVRRMHKYAPIPADDRKKLMKYTGKVMHFIQDMAVPAHAIPIFHTAPSPKDSFDSYGKDKDTITFEASQKICGDLMATAARPRKLLDRVAHQTLATLDKPVSDKPAEADLTWAAFWPPETFKKSGKRKIFSTYGACAPAFLRDPKDKPKDFPKKCDVSPETLNGYYQDRYRDAAEASFALLVYLSDITNITE